MNENPQVGRNAPCPCGSGRKFKQCCERQPLLHKPSEARSPLHYVVVAVACVGLGIVLGRTVFAPVPPERIGVTASSSATSTLLPSGVPAPALDTRVGGLTPKPPGPVPPGKVWSIEHGHWHDIAAPGGQTFSTTGNPTSPATAPVAPTPQPPGSAPEGKVWSPEHGHWHDAPTAAPSTASGDDLLKALNASPLDQKPQQP